MSRFLPALVFILASSLPASASDEESLRNIFTSAHKEAQRLRTWDAYNKARAAYAKYLEHYPNARYVYKIRWYYATIIFQMQDYYAAAREYARVVEMDRNGRYSHEAAYRAVLCWYRCVLMSTDDRIDCREWKPKPGQTFGFIFRVNNNKGPALVFGADKSATKTNGLSLHPYWQTSPSCSVRWALGE